MRYTPRIGDTVLVRLGRGDGELLPMIVTHVGEDNSVCGTAFSGLPARLGWPRGAMEMRNIAPGQSNRQWQPLASQLSLTDAIGMLEPGNPDHWTKGDEPKPKVPALEEILQRTVSAAERDQAWEQLNPPADE